MRVDVVPVEAQDVGGAAFDIGPQVAVARVTGAGHEAVLDPVADQRLGWL